MNRVVKESWITSDGTPLLLRPLRIQDAPALGALFEGLSPEDRRRRFHHAAREFPRSWLDTLAGVDQREHVALATVAARSEAGPLIAEARWVIDTSRDAAEFALVVAPAWRRHGVGTRCVRALLHAASRRGLARIYGTVLAHNAPMLALMRHCGFQSRPKSGDPTLVMVEARVDEAAFLAEECHN
jgi:acetyltransferase